MRMPLWECEFEQRWKMRDVKYLEQVVLADLVRDSQVRILNSGRATADEQHVEAIALHLEDGGTVPPLMLERTHDGRLRIIDGYNRTEALELTDRTTHDAYLLGFDNEGARDDFVESVNTWTNGREIPKEHREQKALEALYKRGLSVGRAAALFQIKPERLQRLKRISDIRARLAAIGVKLDKAGEATIEVLGREKRDECVQKIASVMQERQVHFDTVRLIIKKTQEARSDREALRAVEEWSEQIRKAEPPPTPRESKRRRAQPKPILQQLVSMAEWFNRMLEKAIKGPKPPHLVELVRPIIATTAENLDRLGTALGSRPRTTTAGRRGRSKRQ